MVTAISRAPKRRWPLVMCAGMHAGQFERNDLFAQQRHDPADRADEARAALAGPVHRLGKVDFQDDAGQRFGQNVLGLPAWHLAE